MIAALLAVALLGALVWGVATLLAGPSRVDVVIENPTPYELRIQARSATGGGLVTLGHIGASRTAEYTGVIDRGARWLFIFSYGGVHGGELEVSRAVLENGPVVVPQEVETTLRDAGFPPSPS